MELLKKIQTKEAKIGIIGLGYVGLPLVIEFCNAGYKVTGFDIDENKVSILKRGKSYIKHIDADLIKKCSSLFFPVSDFSKLSDMDCIIVCVPTPLNKYSEPDMSYVFNTAHAITDNLQKDQLIVLESTTYPGTTEDDMRAILEESGFKAGVDFHLAYSPEREDPNNKDYTTKTIPKVVGGYTPECLKVATVLYSQIIEKVINVSSPKVAEAAKLLENIYRAVNIALVNELKMLFDKMDIDVWEVIDAAKTKPFGFQAFYPGPGLGGHCIPIDPFYLTWKAKEYDVATKFISLAGEINTTMPNYVVRKTMEALNQHSKSLKGSKILVLGLSYKKDVDDVRESPSLKLIELYTEMGAEVDYNDPYVSFPLRMRKYTLEKESVPLTAENLKKYDCIVIATDHSVYNAEDIVRNAQLIVDTRNFVQMSPCIGDKVKKA